MRKKRVLFTGIIIILFSLFVHVKFSDGSMKTEITITNIEALAEQETTGEKPRYECTKAGYICVGYNKDGAYGQHAGLSLN